MGKRSSASQRERLQAILRGARLRAGLSQQQVADRLGRPQSFVSKYESGERRLDILELREVCRAIKLPLATFVRKFERALD